MPAAVDLTGERFGRLVALRGAGSTHGGKRLWLCARDCGTTKVVAGVFLSQGVTRSCGCLRNERLLANRCTFAGAKKHGMVESPEYKAWQSMRQRCINPQNKSFADYGGRGITVCDRWLESFERFYADMGPRPVGMTLERRRVNEGYSPENCEWATRKEQSNNKRSSVRLEHKNRTQTVTQWAEEIGMKPGTLLHRVKAGWDAERALTTPVTNTRKSS